MSNGEYKKFEKFCWNAASIQRHLRAHRASSTSISSSQDTYPPPSPGVSGAWGSYLAPGGPLLVRWQSAASGTLIITLPTTPGVSFWMNGLIAGKLCGITPRFCE